MIQFLPYQARWIKDNSPIKLYEKSRRIGITFATSYRSVTKCLREKDNSTFIQWVSSRDELTAKQFIVDYVAMWAREANKISRELAAGFAGAIGLDGLNIEVVDEKHGITAFVVRFKNGSRINSISSNPLAFAGKGGDVLIDEWDLHEDQAAIYDMALPCTIMGNQLELVSAYDPNGSEDTEFARKCRKCAEGDDPDTSFHSTTVEQAIDDGYVEMINEIKIARGVPPQTRDEFRASLRRKCRTRGSYDSQFMCSPNQASGESVVSPSDLGASKSAFDILRIHLTGNGGELDVTDPVCAPYLNGENDKTGTVYWREIFAKCGRLALGWDIAVTGDLGAIFINREDQARKKLLVCMTFKGCKLESQRRIIEAMYDAHSSLVGCGDQSAVGYSDCVKLETKYYGRFVGIMFNGPSKLEIMTGLTSCYEAHMQMLPLNCPEIASDVKAMKTGKTPNGRLTYIHGANDLLEDSHCDVCIANALAIHAGATVIGGPYLFTSAADDNHSTPGEGGNYARSRYPDHSDDR